MCNISFNFVRFMLGKQDLHGLGLVTLPSKWQPNAQNHLVLWF